MQRRDEEHPGGETPVAADRARLSGAQLRWATAGVLLALFLSTLAQTVVSTAMPRIVAELGGFDRYTWPSTAYLVASAVAVPIVGRLADMYGRRLFFMVGLVIFIAGALAAGTSQSMTQLIAARAIQGIGGGTLATNSLVAVADLFPPEERGKAQGLAAMVLGVAVAIGPVLGGLITDAFSWHWIFLFNVPAALVVLALIARTFPAIASEVEQRGLDYPGTACLTLAVVPLLLALSMGGVQYGWTSAEVIGLMAFGLAMTAAFVAVESRARSPIMPLEIYRNPMVSAGAAVLLLTGMVLYGSIIFTNLFFQAVLGASAARSGLFMTPMLLAVLLGAALAGRRLSGERRHYRVEALVNTGITAAGAFLLVTLGEDAGLWQAASYVAVLGLGVGGTLATMNVGVQNSVPYSLVGASTAALQFSRSIGATLGLAVMGAVMANGFSRRLETALPDAVRAALPPGRLDALTAEPRAVMDPAARDALGADLEAAGHAGGVADMLLESLVSALSGAVGEAFMVIAAAAALSVATALFLRRPDLEGATGEPRQAAQAPSVEQL